MKTLLSVLLCLAGSTNLFAAEQKPLAVTSADNGKTLTAKVGQAIVVSLKGNPTTGYTWILAGIDSPAVALDGKIKYQENAHPEGMVGVPGMFQAKFKALQPGKATVKLEYRRPWEKDKQPAETFSITISVEK